MRRRKKKADRAVLRRRVIILGILALAILVLAILAPYLAPNDPLATNSAMMKAAPCAQFPFGTDKLGRCVLSRVLYGARTSVFASLALVAVSFVVGTAAGILCGYVGGVLDEIIMRIADIFLAFPQMVLAIAVAGILGGSLLNAMIALGITGWTLYARLARGTVMSLKEEPFIAAARLQGLRSAGVMVKHLLPNVAGPLLVNATTQIGTTMIGIAGLSFLGIGVILPTPEWGSMISEARSYMQLAPWAVFAPAAAVVITVMVYNLFGDSVRDLLDVQSQEQTASAPAEPALKTAVQTAVAEAPKEDVSFIPDSDALLNIADLSIRYSPDPAAIPAADGLSFSLKKGEVLAVLGESGSGKSSLLKAILDPALFGVHTAGSIRLDGEELTALPEAARRRYLGRKMTMIFQDPGAAFQPVRSYRKQLKEMLRDVGLYDPAAFESRVIDTFARLGLPDGARILRSSPCEMSGGMNQRIAIAAAMLLEPELLLLDEPTSALDVTTQKAVLEELEQLRTLTGTAMILVTHHPGVAMRLADRTAVMYRGRIVEYGETERVLRSPENSYTRELIGAIPTLQA
ncbi:MAG: dipeptide/oligopeptide/nickel ABC transporter permease/ATP-binding protein [Lachnospiraceae bacterium]|nr:dipeptide/oligopeptide/nickel ABC transporter permease/ATP-binding protein [Lachnospiraceae bacterium]